MRMATILAPVLELTILSLLAATCCLAASSLQVENFPILFATLSLLAAIVALWRRPDDFKIATCFLMPHATKPVDHFQVMLSSARRLARDFVDGGERASRITVAVTPRP